MAFDHDFLSGKIFHILEFLVPNGIDDALRNEHASASNARDRIRAVSAVELGAAAGGLMVPEYGRRRGGTFV
jgi:hypothetical protein